MRCRYSFYLCLTCLLLSAFYGCKVKKPANIIPESQFENVLYDYHLAKAMGNDLPLSENYKKVLYLNAVYEKYGITEAEFDSSMVWYTRHTELLADIYERVGERLKKEQDAVNDLIAIRDKKPKMTKSGDSIDIWPWARIARLTEGANSIYAFNLLTDTNYKARDTIVWKARFHFIPPQLPDSTRYATMALQIVYEKDTICHLNLINSSGNKQITLYADTLGRMTEIKGLIYYPAGKGNLLLAEGLSMVRYHCKDSLPFAVRDSLNRIEAQKKDSLLNNDEEKERTDKLIKGQEETPQRQDPEDMNRRRKGGTTVKKPEQIKVEQHIQQERRERQKLLRQQRRQNRN